MPKLFGIARRAICGETAPERRLLAGRAKDLANTILKSVDRFLVRKEEQEASSGAGRSFNLCDEWKVRPVVWG